MIREVILIRNIHQLKKCLTTINYNSTLLCWAIIHKQKQIIKFILNYGVDVNSKLILYDSNYTQYIFDNVLQFTRHFSTKHNRPDIYRFVYVEISKNIKINLNITHPEYIDELYKNEYIINKICNIVTILRNNHNTIKMNIIGNYLP